MESLSVLSQVFLFFSHISALEQFEELFLLDFELFKHLLKLKFSFSFGARVT
jgi:hypothetical protein